MRIMQILLSLCGRFFLSIIFISSAIRKIVDWQGAEKELVALFWEWYGYVSHSEILQKMFTDLMPWIPMLLISTTVIELVGALFILLGFRVRLGAFLLILFFIPVTIFFHQFWYLEEIKRDMQLMLFLKNIAILGGLFYVLAYGKDVTIIKKRPLEEEISSNIE